MNIAYFLLPKSEVAYLRENMTVRQGLEKMKRSGFTAIPVIDRQNRYKGVISEGDFLWSILQITESLEEVSMKNMEDLSVKDILSPGRTKAVCIDKTMEELLEQAQNKNFVPVIDDRKVFIGIVTRKDIMKYFIEINLVKR